MSTRTDSGEDSLKTGWLEESARVATLVARISEILIELKAKRATLEERMLARYLLSLGSCLALLAGRIFDSMGAAKQPEVQALGELKELNLEMTSALEELLKMARYDANFLEQYYEYDFYRKLVNDHCFLERAKTICASLN